MSDTYITDLYNVVVVAYKFFLINFISHCIIVFLYIYTYSVNLTMPALKELHALIEWVVNTIFITLATPVVNVLLDTEERQCLLQATQKLSRIHRFVCGLSICLYYYYIPLEIWEMT